MRPDLRAWLATLQHYVFVGVSVDSHRRPIVTGEIRPTPYQPKQVAPCPMRRG